MARAAKLDTLTRIAALLSRERLSQDGKVALLELRGLCRESKPSNDPGQLVLIPLLKLSPVKGCPLVGTRDAEAPAAQVCVTRQRISEVQRPNGPPRRPVGVASEYPSCVTERCEIGRRWRALLDPNHVPWEGGSAGSYASRAKLTQRQDVQEAARQRLARVGLLDEVPDMDGNGLRVEPEGEEA